jgi:hypothetical protein
LAQQAQKREIESVEKFLEELTKQFENEEAVEWKKELQRRRSGRANEESARENF